MALAHALCASFAPLSRKSTLQYCSQGANAIPPNGIPGLEALNSTSPLVLLRRISTTSGVLTDVVKEPETLTAAAFKKRLLHSNKPSERHSGLHSAKTLTPFAIPTAALSRAFRKDYFYSCVRAPSKFYMWVFGRPHIHISIYIYIHIYIYICMCTSELL